MAKKILLMEDEKVLGELLSNKLKKEGYDVTWVMDGEEGIAKMRAWKPDLVLLDIVMPKKNGYEVLQEAHQDASINTIPVIVISNSGQPVEIEKIVALGVKDYLVKANFSTEEVLAKVVQHLAGQTESTTDHAGTHILLVEDDPFLSSLAGNHLRKRGYDVRIASDGPSAIAACEKQSPSLVLLDLIMPDMSGFDVLKKFNTMPGMKGVPVIILSNLGQETDIEEAKRLGATDFLVKARFNLSDITQKIEATLAKQKMAAAA